MASVIITVKLMPESPDVDLSTIETEAKSKITAFAGEGDMKIEQEPIAFGLKALNIIFVMDEDKGSTEELEKDLASIDKVNSVEVTDVRRAIG